MYQFVYYQRNIANTNYYFILLMILPKMHVSSATEGEEVNNAYECSLCDFSSKWKHGLQVHISRKHKNISKLDVNNNIFRYNSFYRCCVPHSATDLFCFICILALNIISALKTPVVNTQPCVHILFLPLHVLNTIFSITKRSSIFTGRKGTITTAN